MLGLHLVLVALYHGSQLVSGNTIKVDDTKLILSVAPLILNWIFLWAFIELHQSYSLKF